MIPNLVCVACDGRDDSCPVCHEPGATIIAAESKGSRQTGLTPIEVVRAEIPPPTFCPECGKKMTLSGSNLVCFCGVSVSQGFVVTL